ncbi:uncharacterized protein LOC141855916 [Brevipalpus obovatus]|uniref:uncharacterized protein LOC141855916 n=1 Tax=Brevipalpus obovatus TaxID=246614 RepID=UPI003D9F003E
MIRYLVLVVLFSLGASADTGTEPSDTRPSEVLATLDPFQMCSESISKAQAEFVESAGQMVDVIQVELAQGALLKGKKKEEFETTMKEYIQDLEELQERFFTLRVKDAQDRKQLKFYITLFGKVIETATKYIESGPHKSILEKVAYKFKEKKNKLMDWFKKVGKGAKTFLVGFVFRTAGMEDDDDDPDEYRNIFFAPDVKPATPPPNVIMQQVMVPFGVTTLDRQESEEKIRKHGMKVAENDEGFVDGPNNDQTSIEKAAAGISAAMKNGNSGVGISILGQNLIISIPLTILPSVYQQQQMQPQLPAKPASQEPIDSEELDLPPIDKPEDLLKRTEV